MDNDKQNIKSILKELFPSEEMASYLAGCSLKQWQIRDAVAYAAIPLERKRDVFLQLASEKDRPYFRHQAGCIEQAIREMQTKPGEFFYLKSHRYIKEDGGREEGLEPYLSWEHIFERIREYLGCLEDDEKELTWFQVEKWSPDGSGRLYNDYDYDILGGEVCYFSSNRSLGRGWHDFSTYHDLNLPVPFRAGDIVTVDCRPFAPVSHVVILETGDNRDCCCLQALYRNSDGTWNIGAVKHGHIFPEHLSSGISLLYRLASFHGQLPKEERLLEKVSRYVNGDEKRGSALWNYICDLGDDKREWAATEEQIYRCLSNPGMLL